MDFIFPVRALPSVTYPPYIYEGMGNAQMIHSSLSNLGTISLKSGNLLVKNVLFWRGLIKRPNLQKAYRYRAESFWVDSNLIGRSNCAVTRSNLMRVSHSWTPKLNILEILKHFWPASEPCIQATIKDMDFIFPTPALRSVIYPPCKYESMYMSQLIHSNLSKLGTIPLKSGNLRVKMSYSEWGPSNGQIYKRSIDTGLNHSGSIPIWLGDLPVQLQGLSLCGSVTVGRQNWIFLKF